MLRSCLWLNERPEAARLAYALDGLIDPVNRYDLDTLYRFLARITLGCISFGNDGKRESQLGCFFQTLLTPLNRAHFTGQSDFAERHHFLWQRPAS